MAHDLAYAYDLLQVTPNASEKEMRAAWRRLARRYHPDLAKTNPEEAARRMSEINAAYDTVAHHIARQNAGAAPKPSLHRSPRTARQAAECQAWRRQRDAMARKAAKAWKAAQVAAAPVRVQATPQLDTPKPLQLAPKAAAKWNRAEQSLINSARAAFEGTRKTLGTGAPRPVFSACH